MIDEGTSVYLPSWLVRLETSPGSRDPLGLQAQAMSHADQLLPGLNVFTSRARYYTFLCWAIREAQASSPARGHIERVHRLERLLVLTEALRHEDNPDVCSYIGRRRGRRFVSERSGAALWDLPGKILKNQGSNGALRLYRTSLADLGLIEEDDLEDGLGLRLTQYGHQLANQYGKIDTSVVAWALTGQAEQKKRRNTLSGGTQAMCLSAHLGAIERRYLLARLFGPEGHGVERRETIRILFEHGMLLPASSGRDLASEEADLIVEARSRPADEVADIETQGNWAVVRRALTLTPSSRLRLPQAAGAYQILALGLNALFSAVLRPVDDYGRVSIAVFRRRVAERAGSGFEAGPAAVWAGRRKIVDIADDLLDGEKPWPEVATLAMELLLRATRDARTSMWLSDSPTSTVERALLWGREADTKTAGQLIAKLGPELVEHHAEVSARKGKGEWIHLDGREFVRGDSRPLRLMLHALRFPQLAQLAADLRLTNEDVTDEA